MKKRVLTLKGLPVSIVDTKWGNAQLQSPAGFNKLAIQLYNNANSTIFVYNDSGTIIDRMIDDDTCSTMDIIGVDYPKYFSGVFNGGNGTIRSKVLYIFDVGEELANSTSYSDKVLSNLIKVNKAQGNTTIIASDLYATTLFKRNYPITAKLVDEFTQIRRNL